MKFPYQLPTLFSILILQLSNVLLAQNQFPEPEVLGGIMPERGQVFEQGYGGDYNEEILDIANTTFGLAVCGWEANDKINVLLFHKQKASIVLLNLNGQIVKTQQVEFNSNIIDISVVKAGVYVVEVNGESGVQEHKFVKE